MESINDLIQCTRYAFIIQYHDFLGLIYTIEGRAWIYHENEIFNDQIQLR